MPAFLKKITKKQWCAIAKNAVVLLLLFALLFAITLLSLNAAIKSVTKDKILEPHTAAQLGDIDCILVLGCHVRSQYLADRLTTAFGLYDMGASPKLLMTGDHGRTEYNEVGTMKAHATSLGIPSSDVFMDHAGFSTYDSMYRARSVFKVTSAIVVTQKLHLRRALYIGDKMGIKVTGVEAKNSTAKSTAFQSIREYPARVKAFLQCEIFHSKPKYLGEVIPITGNGIVTEDNLTK